MTRINTNVSSLTAQKNLAKSNVQLQQALTRLSTGLRINSGKDDPAGLIASEMLRSDIVSTQKAISNTERANQMIATTDSALGQVSSLLNDIRGLVTEAANEGALSAEQIEANQLQVNSSLEALNRISQTTSFQGRKLLDGSLDFIKTDVSNMNTVSDLQITSANFGTATSIPVSVTISNAAEQASISATLPNAVSAAQATNLDWNAGSRITGGAIDFTAHTAGAEGNNIRVIFYHGAEIAADQILTSYNYDDVNLLHEITVSLSTSTNNYDLGAIVAAISTVTDNGGTVLVDATEDGGGSATYDASSGGTTTAALTGGQDASGGLSGNVVFELSGLKGSQVFNFLSGTTGELMEAAINQDSDATGVEASFNGTSRVLTLTSTDYGEDAFVQYKEISDTAGAFDPTADRDIGADIVAKVNGILASGKGNTLSIDTATLALMATVTDGSTTTFSFTINGGGALFQLGPDVVSNQQSRIGIQSVNSARLGGKTGKLYEIGMGGDYTLTANPKVAAQIVEEAITQVTMLRGRLGALQKTSLETNVNALNDTLEALTGAESSIRDADFAAETAALTRSQILVQSGTAVLQIANRNPQNVLALLQG